jgi:hypothetical protein
VPAEAEEEERPEAEELLDPMSEQQQKGRFRARQLVFLLFLLCCAAARTLC